MLLTADSTAADKEGFILASGHERGVGGLALSRYSVSKALVQQSIIQ